MKKVFLRVERKAQGEVCKDQTTQRLTRAGRSRYLCKPCLNSALDGSSEGDRDQQEQQCNGGEKRVYLGRKGTKFWGLPKINLCMGCGAERGTQGPLRAWSGPDFHHASSMACFSWENESFFCSIHESSPRKEQG